MEQILAWQIKDEKLININTSKLDAEQRLEKWIAQDFESLFPDQCFIGSQVTIGSKKIDILSINQDGVFTIIELKRGQTTRETISQALDYAAMLSQYSDEELISIITGKNEEAVELTSYLANKMPGKNWEDFDISEAKTNAEIIVAGTSIDDDTIRIINYLREKGVNAKAIAFSYFKTPDGCEFIAKNYTNIDDGSEQITSRKERIVLALFKNNRIMVGDKFYYAPAITQGIPKDDPRICFAVVKQGTRCLKRENDENIYSFSKSRRLLIEELNIEGIKPNWGFGIKTEWKSLKNDKTLEELSL